jgi:uncharacterized protein YdaL
MLGCVVLVLVGNIQAQVLTPAISGQGKDIKTLIVYAGVHAPYSLADDLAALKLQLRRIAGTVEDIPVGQADVARISAADYVVIFCPQPFPEFAEPLLRAIAQRRKPVLWIGYGADRLEGLPPFEGKFKIAAFASEVPAETITYQGTNWSETFTLWIPARIPAIETNSVILSVPMESDGKTSSQPVAWKTAHVTFVTALPTLTANCALFSDLLLDFYAVAAQPRGVVCIRIDGYHCRQDHQEFRRLVDCLADRGHPFIVGVIPAFYDAQKDKVLNLDTQPEFVAALRYAQQRGGRLVMQGYLHANKGRTGQEPEFWNALSDTALAGDNADYVRQRIEAGLRQFFAKGLFPIGWETPRYAASRANYAEFARYFSTAVERIQLSDATAQENFAGTACAADDHGRLIVPENLGVITGLRGAQLRIQARAEVVSRLRGTISLCSFPAYLSENKLAQAVTLLEQLRVPFLDLADGNHWVQSSDMLLLTGNASRTVNLNNARIRWQAFDRKGRLMAEEYEPTPFTGERVFEPRQKGDYEIYQFNQAQP